MAQTVKANHAHLIGIGRPSVYYPTYPQIIFNTGASTATEDSPLLTTDALPDANNIYYPKTPNPGWIRALKTGLLGAGINTAWHCALMWRMTTGRWDGLKSRTHPEADWAAPTVEEIQRAPLTGKEMPRFGAIRSMYEMWACT